MIGPILHFIPGYMPPNEPIYSLPPDELEAEIEYSASYFRTLSEERDWGHSNLGLAAIHEKGIVGDGVLIAICDTGIDVDHPDLDVISTGHRDFTGSPSGFYDRQGHGTHCAGISAASANGSGLIGAAPKAKTVAVKVLSDQGSGASSWIAAGIRYAADLGADIISLSLGGPSPDSRTRDAIIYAANKGSWVMCAAGNDGRQANSYPGHYPESLAVCATDNNNKRASFSTINAQNDISAPGVQILSTLPGNRYGRMSGTSMATPYVAGTLALLRGEIKRQNRNMPKQSDIITAVRTLSTDIPPTGPDSGTGGGLLDVSRLLKEFLGNTTPPPPPPPPPGGDGVFDVKLRIDPKTKIVIQV